MSGDPLDLRCPCCQARIIVDPGTGAILRFERPREEPGQVSFEDAFRNEKARKKEADEKFARAFGEMKKKEEILEKRFQEAVRKAQEDPDAKPLHPFDKDLE